MEVQVSGTYLVQIIMTSTVLAGVLAAIITLLGQVILKKIERKHKQEDKKEDKEDEKDVFYKNITKALQVLYYDKIQYLVNRYIAEGSITFKEIEDLDEMHKVYKECLEGDGLLDRKMCKAHALEHVTSKPDGREKIENALREIMGGGYSKKPDTSENNDTKERTDEE